MGLAKKVFCVFFLAWAVRRVSAVLARRQARAANSIGFLGFDRRASALPAVGTVIGTVKELHCYPMKVRRSLTHVAQLPCLVLPLPTAAIHYPPPHPPTLPPPQLPCPTKKNGPLITHPDPRLKSCRGVRVKQAQLTNKGFDGDRCLMIINSNNVPGASESPPPKHPPHTILRVHSRHIIHPCIK
jgi:hypothetical protein